MEEFNHLLQADTYAQGRLFNPVHPLAVILQAPQVVQWPHYMSTRPPLAGIFLYLGQVLAGSPFLGNLLCVALTSAALAWMLMEWLPRRWAALGTLVVIATYCLFGYWVNSYWCPAPNVLGAAVLLALVPRIERGPRLWHSALFVLAMALLAGIRPYENGVYAATILLWLAVRFLQPARRPMLRQALLRFALPVGLGGLVILGGMAWYNDTTMGNIGVMPYSIWRLAQCFVPPFLWQPLSTQPSPSPPRRGEIRAVGGRRREADQGRRPQRCGDNLRPPCGDVARSTRPRCCCSACCAGRQVGSRSGQSILGHGRDFHPGRLAVHLLVLVRRADQDAAPLCTLSAVAEPGRAPARAAAADRLVATSLSSFYMSIYFAAFLPPLILLAIGGLKHLALWSRPHGAGIAGMLMIGTFLFTGLEAWSDAAGNKAAGLAMSRFDEMPFKERAAVLKRMAAEPGRQLILVRNLAPGKSVAEMVWNGANVDSERIVWAHDIRPEWTAAAIRYFRPRKVWLVEMIRTKGIGKPIMGVRLKPYPVQALPAPAPLDSLPMPDRDAAIALGARLR